MAEAVHRGTQINQRRFVPSQKRQPTQKVSVEPFGNGSLKFPGASLSQWPVPVRPLRDWIRILESEAARGRVDSVSRRRKEGGGDPRMRLRFRRGHGPFPLHRSACRKYAIWTAPECVSTEGATGVATGFSTATWETRERAARARELRAVGHDSPRAPCRRHEQHRRYNSSQAAEERRSKTALSIRTRHLAWFFLSRYPGPARKNETDRG